MDIIKNIKETGMAKDGIFYYITPVKAYLYEFMDEHPCCSVLIKNRGEPPENTAKTLNVEVVAYVENPKENYKLSLLYGNDKRYEIYTGIDSSEAAFID